MKRNGLAEELQDLPRPQTVEEIEKVDPKGLIRLRF